MKRTYVLAIGSFAVHGTASLKTFITLLGEKVLPVPSLLLNGLTNMSMVKKFDTPFENLLQSTLELAVDRDLELILYIGYLGKAEQTDIITRMIHTYRSVIKTIIVDPVCGDQGRTYVPTEIIEKWPDIISLADYAFPNITELKLLTGHSPQADGSIEFYATQFKNHYPAAHLIITSIKPDSTSIGIKYFDKEGYDYSHTELSKNYGGTGDAFLALFIRYHFYEYLTFKEALKQAADDTYQIISNSIDHHSEDLLFNTKHNYTK